MKLKLLSFVGGLGTGYLANQLWAHFGLPGYGVCQIPLDGSCIGQDDLILMGIGIAIAVYGYMNFRMAIWFGLGWVTGQIIGSFIQVTGSTTAKTSTPGTATVGI